MNVRPSPAASCSARSTRSAKRLAIVAQGELRVDVQATRDVDRREEHVAELLEDPRVGLGLGCGLARFGERFLELAQLVVEVGDRPGRVGVFEVDRRRPPLELPGVEEGGQRLGHVVEDALAAFLLGLDALPILTDAPGRSRLHFAEDVRVASDELVVAAPGDGCEVAGALLFEQKGEKVGLEEEIAELVLELRSVAGVGGVGDLVGLLDGVGDDRPCRLLPVPGAIAPEALGQALEPQEGFSEPVLASQRRGSLGWSA